jgi:hypothetical protein
MAAMSSKTRLWKLTSWAGLILGIGLAYALWVHLTGLAMPCPIKLVTGLWCPGCGATRMCLALLRLDLYGALRSNAGLCLLLPVLAALIGQQALHWVKTGRAAPPTPQQNALVWGMVWAMLAYGVVRNLPGLSFLAPAG